MAEIHLKYGCNPNQPEARVIQPDSEPLEVVNGRPSYINLMDGLRSWQLVRDLKKGTGKAAAASYKHVSPAGAAVAGDLSVAFRQSQFIAPETELSPAATAYAKARSSDRPASFGDFIAVSEVVDETLANLIKPEVSDGIIAPGYAPEALEILKQKKKGGYVMLQMDPHFRPPAVEERVEFGMTLKQSHNDAVISPDLLQTVVTAKKELSDDEVETAIVATATLKHTQSNSVCVGYKGHAIGVGAGQQSRIACTRLACGKSDRWFLKLHPKALSLAFRDGLPRSEKVNAVESYVRWHELDETERYQLEGQLDQAVEPLTDEEIADWLGTFDLGGVVLSSDAFFPFRDNLDRAAQSGVRVVVQPGGSARDKFVIEAADQHGMVMCFTGLRLFLH